ncbi:MAG: AsmA family protein [Desulfuromonadales bacterium]|nr:AsmA family protein [Desulfuromonadales bacterium]
MSKLIKIFLGISAFVAILLIAMVVMVKVFVTPERVKAVILPIAEQALHRSITLGEVKVGFFSGIELHDLTVGEPGEKIPFIAADRVVLRFQLLPLLAKRVIVDEVILERPQIRLIRRVDGTLSINDLLAPKPGSTPAAASGAPPVTAPGSTPAAESASPQGKPTPFTVLVTVAQIRDGRLSFVDQQVNATTELTELKLDASGISSDGTVPVKLAARLQGAPLQVEGVVRPLQKNGKVRIDLQGMDALAFEPYFRGKVPGKLSRLLLDLKGEFDLQGRIVTARGSLEGRELNLFLLALPTAPLQNARVKTDFDVSFDLDRDRLDIASLAVDFNGLAARLAGGISEVATTPEVDLKLTVPELDLAMLKSALPPALLGKAGEIDLAGTLRASASLSGSFDRPQQMLRNGEVTLEKVQATVGGIRPEIDGRLKLTGDQLQTDALNVRLGDDSAQLKMNIRNLFARPLIINADLTAARFPIEALMGGAAGSTVNAGGGQVSSGAAGQAPAVGKEIGPIDLPVQASGAIRIGEGGWRGLTVKNFLADYELRDNQLNIRRMTGNFAGGSFSNTARVDLRQPGLAYETAVNLQGVDMQSLLPALAPAAAGSMFGKLDLQGNLNGSGTRWSNISRTLSGDVALVLVDGRLVSPALVNGFASFLQLPDLNEIVFSDFRGKARIAAGRAEIDSSIQSSRLKLFPRGTLGLDGSLNLAMDTRLSPELAARIDQRGKVTRYLVDADGWTQLPLLVSGTLQAPRYGLDPKGVQAQAGRVLQNELQRGLDKLLKKSQPQPTAPTDSTQPQPAGTGGPAPQQAPPQGEQAPVSSSQKLLEESLKKVFGR